MDAFLQSHRTLCSNEATHLSLTGGKYSIRTPEDVEQFRILYVREPNRHYLVERVCYPSVFYMDLDHCTIDADRLCSQIKATFDQVFVYTNRQGGFHIIFRSIIAKSPTDAVRLCENICIKCPMLSPFADSSVYYSGLRMIGSKKSTKVARVYFPIRASRNITLLDLKQSSIHHQIQTSRPWASVRTSRPSLSKSNTPQIDFRQLHEEYSDIQVKSLRYTQPWATIISDSTFCLNVNRHHNSKNAYFVLNLETKTMAHKCLCRCESTGCKDYRSKPVKIPARAYSIIHAQLL